MKIGIVTQPLMTNYGGILQNYALQEVLRRNGHEPCTLDWGWKPRTGWKSEYQRIKCNLKAKIVSFLGSRPAPRYRRYHLTEQEYSIIAANTSCFIAQYIAKTPPIYKPEGFSEWMKTKNFDVVVAGSDQVWRPCYNRFLEEMFLRFAAETKVKKIAYAASFGSEVWEMNAPMTAACAALAKKFDLITVREFSGVDLCRQYLGVDPTPVLDPTLLLTKNDYIGLVEADNVPKSEGTLFYYVLDPTKEIEAAIRSIASENNWTPFKVMPDFPNGKRTKWDVKFRIQRCVYPSVTKWLRAFMDAEYVIVDSFHGTIFSILFNKPFLAIENSNRGNARFHTILSLFGLKDRLIKDEDLKDFDIHKEIDWNHVNQELARLREKSLSLLLNSLTPREILVD